MGAQIANQQDKLTYIASYDALETEPDGNQLKPRITFI